MGKSFHMRDSRNGSRELREDTGILETLLFTNPRDSEFLGLLYSN